MTAPNTHFTSDVHFGHNNIIKFCNRPFSSVEEMNEQLIERWNNVVKPNDTVWSLGDFAFLPYEQTKQIIKRLNGNLHMVLGNHCQKIAQNRKELISSGLVKEIHDYKEISVQTSAGKQKICLFHYAQRAWNGSHYGSWQLFGHTHGDMEPYGKSVDVGIDSPFVTGQPEYRPFSLEEVEEFMRNQPIFKHHDE